MCLGPINVIDNPESGYIFFWTSGSYWTLLARKKGSQLSGFWKLTVWVCPVSEHNLKPFLAIGYWPHPWSIHPTRTLSSPAHLRPTGLWKPGPSRTHCAYTMDPGFESSSHTYAESPDGPGLHQPRGKCGEPALAQSQQAASCLCLSDWPLRGQGGVSEWQPAFWAMVKGTWLSGWTWCLHQLPWLICKTGVRTA